MNGSCEYERTNDGNVKYGILVCFDIEISCSCFIQLRVCQNYRLVVSSRHALSMDNCFGFK